MSKSLFVFARKNHLLMRLAFSVAAFMLAASGPFVWFVGHAEAAQITARSLTLTSAKASAVTTYTFNFTVPTTGTKVLSFSAQACDAPVGTCNTPSGFSVTGSGINQPTGLGASSGWTVNTATAGSLRMSDASNASNPSGSQTVTFTNVTNPDTTYVTSAKAGAFYLRMTTYSDANWTAAIDTGTTASAVTQTLTINANVAEVLNFCIGSTLVDDATTDPTNAGNHDCTQISGTSVNIGTLDSGSVNVSPVTDNGGDSSNGIAMVRSNAANGVDVYYRAIQASTGTNHLGTLRLTGANCDAVNDNTDGCINAIGNTQTKITAGDEDFGMTIAGVNCGSTTSYTCNYSAGEYDLVPQPPYVGQASNTFCATDTCNIAGNGFAWDETGTSELIASSSSSTIPQVDDEALILKFAATSNIITPFGPYSVQTDFIAVPSY